jgi:hypothetical protein
MDIHTLASNIIRLSGSEEPAKRPMHKNSHFTKPIIDLSIEPEKDNAQAPLLDPEIQKQMLKSRNASLENTHKSRS